MMSIETSVISAFLPQPSSCFQARRPVLSASGIQLASQVRVASYPPAENGYDPTIAGLLSHRTCTDREHGGRCLFERQRLFQNLYTSHLRQLTTLGSNRTGRFSRR